MEPVNSRFRGVNGALGRFIRTSRRCIRKAVEQAPAEASEHQASGVAWALAVLGPLAVSGILVGFRDQFGSSNAALVLVLVVLAAAIAGGRGGGVVSAVVSALCFDFFFTRPYYSFTIDNRDDIQTTIVLLIVGLTVGELVVRTRRSRRIARQSRREVEQVRRVAALGAGGETAGKLIQLLQRELVEALGVRAARFERPPFATALPRLGHGSVTVPAQANGTPMGPGNEVELPVWGQGREFGRFVLVLAEDSTGISINPDDRALAAALADQLGAALAATTETT
jgi:hypothetical protein